MVCLQENGPLVSVIMGTRNGAQFLREAIDSILAQTFSDFEFLIVDDGSTDSTPEIMREAAARDQRITVVSQRHRGIPRTLNRAIALTHGKYIAKQDDDDMSVSTRLQRQVDFMEHHPDHALVGSSFEVINSRGDHIRDSILPEGHDEIRARIFRDWVFMSPTFLMRRSAVLEVGGFRAEFPLGEDTDLELRLSERFKVANISDVLYHYRTNRDSVSRRMRILKDTYLDIAREMALQRMEQGTDILLYPSERSE